MKVYIFTIFRLNESIKSPEKLQTSIRDYYGNEIVREFVGNMNIVEARQEVQPRTEGNVSPENYITTEHQPVKIENNSRVHVVNITTCDKCNTHASESCGETSDVTSLCSQLTNINIDITNNFGIVIITHNGQYNLDVQPDNTIEEVKSRIQSKEGISSAEQRLYFDGKCLRDDRTLASYNIHNGSTVQLVFRLRGGFQLFIKILGGTTITITVDNENTIEEIKEKIYEMKMVSVEPHEQHLIYAGKQLQDNRTLADYQIPANSSIQLVPSYKGGSVNMKENSRCSMLLDQN